MNPLNHPGVHQIPQHDVEKRGELKSTDVDVTTNTGCDTFRDATNTSSSDSSNQQDTRPITPVLLTGKLASWNAKVEGLAGLEARGITRVLPEEKHDGGIHGYLQMVALWFSINLVATNIITGLLGPLVFQLGWVDCVCIVIFANALSSCGASYTSTFGPESGNRTMVRVRAEYIPQDSLELPRIVDVISRSLWLFSMADIVG
jgi:Permease for cytosine/purines, uracil, thiamine, allantoin